MLMEKKPSVLYVCDLLVYNNWQSEAVFHGAPVITLSMSIDKAYNGRYTNIKGLWQQVRRHIL